MQRGIAFRLELLLELLCLVPLEDLARDHREHQKRGNGCDHFRPLFPCAVRVAVPRLREAFSCPCGLTSVHGCVRGHTSQVRQLGGQQECDGCTGRRPRAGAENWNDAAYSSSHHRAQGHGGSHGSRHNAESFCKFHPGIDKLLLRRLITLGNFRAEVLLKVRTNGEPKRLFQVSAAVLEPLQREPPASHKYLQENLELRPSVFLSLFEALVPILCHVRVVVVDKSPLSLRNRRGLRTRLWRFLVVGELLILFWSRGLIQAVLLKPMFVVLHLRAISCAKELPRAVALQRLTARVDVHIVVEAVFYVRLIHARIQRALGIGKALLDLPQGSLGLLIGPAGRMRMLRPVLYLGPGCNQRARAAAQRSLLSEDHVCGIHLIYAGRVKAIVIRTLTAALVVPSDGGFNRTHLFHLPLENFQARLSCVRRTDVLYIRRVKLAKRTSF